MIEFIEINEVKLILLPPPIQHTNQTHQSALPNGLIGVWWLLTGTAAQENEWINLMKLNWWFHFSRRIEWRNQLLLACFLWVGYRLAGQPMAPPKGSEPSQEKQLMESWNQRTIHNERMKQQPTNNKQIHFQLNLIVLVALQLRKERNTKAVARRGKPFSNSHFFFFVKKRNGIAEMEERNWKSIITVLYRSPVNLRQVY